MPVEESFDTIIDPETNHPVPVESKVGQQVVNNYLECLKNGPDSPNIVSTKVFYRKKNPSASKSSKTRPSGSSNTRPSGSSKTHPSGSSNTRPSGSSNTHPSGSSNSKASESGRTLRAKCSGPCGGTNIYSDDARVKSSGKYYHEKCFKKISKD